MSIVDSLNLLSRAEAYSVSFDKDSGMYEVRPKDYEVNLAAVLFPDGWKYYDTGVYNTGRDWEPINIEQLDALREFCESLGGSQ